MSKDPFASVPEFLAAFDNILNNGFFEEIVFNASGKMMGARLSDAQSLQLAVCRATKNSRQTVAEQSLTPTRLSPRAAGSSANRKSKASQRKSRPKTGFTGTPRART